MAESSAGLRVADSQGRRGGVRGLEEEASRVGGRAPMIPPDVPGYAAEKDGTRRRSQKFKTIHSGGWNRELEVGRNWASLEPLFLFFFFIFLFFGL